MLKVSVLNGLKNSFTSDLLGWFILSLGVVAVLSVFYILMINIFIKEESVKKSRAYKFYSTYGIVAYKKMWNFVIWTLILFAVMTLGTKAFVVLFFIAFTLILLSPRYVMDGFENDKYEEARIKDESVVLTKDEESIFNNFAIDGEDSVTGLSKNKKQIDPKSEDMLLWAKELGFNKSED